MIKLQWSLTKIVLYQFQPIFYSKRKLIQIIHNKCKKLMEPSESRHFFTTSESRHNVSASLIDFWPWCLFVLPPFRFIRLNSKISPTKVDSEWWNIFVFCKSTQLMLLFSLKNYVYECINCNACMHKMHALVNFLLILACNDLMHLEVWTYDEEQPNWAL